MIGEVQSKFMSKVKLISILGFLFLASTAFPQGEKVKLYQTFAMHVFIDRTDGVLDANTFMKEINKIKILDNKGFKNVIFLSYSVDELNADTDAVNADNTKHFSCNYIVAYNKKQNKIYHLKGFRTNDFKEFYTYEIDNSYKRKGVSFSKLDDYQVFISDFKVSGLDLGCLYESAILKHKSNKGGCLVSCFRRDEYIGVFR